jgi:hypothetical protein
MFHRPVSGIRLQLWVATALATAALVRPAPAQTDLEARIAAQSAAIEQRNAEIVRLRNSIAGLDAEHRQGVEAELTAAQIGVRAAIEKQKAAQRRIDEHTQSCDVITAERLGRTITPIQMANHNRELADARLELAEAQREEQTFRIRMGAQQARLEGASPVEQDVKQRIAQLTAEVRGLEAALFSLRSQKSQQQLQESIRRSVEALAGRPAAAPAVEAAAKPDMASAPAATSPPAAAPEAAARERLLELARRALSIPVPPAPAPLPPGEVEALLQQLPPRPPAPARTAASTAAGEWLDALRSESPRPKQ